MTLVFALFLLQGTDYMAEGGKALDARKYDTAAELFQKAVAADPKDYAAHFQLALAYSLTSQDTKAEGEYEKTLELKPGLYQAELNLAILRIRNKQEQGAVPLLEHAAKQKPEAYQPQYLLGQALVGTGKAAEAQPHFEAALKADAKSADAEQGLALALLQQGQAEEASRHFARAGELNPAYRAGLLRVAQYYEAKNEPDQAIAIYKQFPEDAAALERVSALLLAGHKYEEAMPMLESAFRESPTQANRLALAQAYVGRQQFDKALPLLKQAIGAEPNSAELRLAYGRLLRDQKQYGPAAQEFYRVTQLKPESREAWSEFAAMLVQLEQYPQALAALDRTAALGGPTAGIYYLRALVLDKTRQLKPALEAYQKFLASSEGKHPDEEFKARQRVRILEHELQKR